MLGRRKELSGLVGIPRVPFKYNASAACVANREGQEKGFLGCVGGKPVLLQPQECGRCLNSSEFQQRNQEGDSSGETTGR